MLKPILRVSLALALALSACSKSEPAAPPAPRAPAGPAVLTFVKKAPTVGTKSVERLSSEMKMAMVVEAGSQKTTTDLQTGELEKQTQEILVVQGLAEVKVKVTYDEKTKSEKNEDGKHTTVASPLKGKTFVVEKKGENVEVTNADGTAPTPEVAALVAEDFEMLGEVDPITRAFPETPIKIGDALPELGDALKRTLNEEGEGEVTVKDAVVTLREERADVGVFEVALTMETVQEPIRLVARLKGELHVRKADTVATVLKLSGPIAISGLVDAPMKFSGTGSLSIDSVTEPVTVAVGTAQ